MTWLVVLIGIGLLFATGIYLWQEKMGAEGLGLAVLRGIALAALLIALFNPVRAERGQGAPPTVLLDASLSMSAAGAKWNAALDSARVLAGPDGTVMRFGEGVSPSDSGLPIDGASRLGPALRTATGRTGPVYIVTDGEIDDRATIPPVLFDGVGIATLHRDTVPDIALLDVSVRERYLENDTVRADFTIGRWKLNGAVSVEADVFTADRRIHTEMIRLPERAPTVRRSISLAPGTLAAGSHVLRFAIRAQADEEPADDERLRVVTITSQPGVVVIVDPADAEGRFLVREITSVVRTGVEGYARVTDDGWVDMTDLTPVAENLVRRMARDASLVVVRSARPDRFSGESTWYWPAAVDGQAEFFDGDWYVNNEVGPSPLAGRFAAVRWDSVPPLTGIIPVVASGDEFVALSGRLGRRGADRPLLIGRDSAGHRALTTTSSGLWRWALRGGAAREAYRATVSSGIDWLLENRTGPGTALISAVTATQRGRPVLFRWHGVRTPDAIPVRLVGSDSVLAVDLRFNSANEARVMLEPGIYRWSVPSDRELGGIVVVEEYSDEFHPRAVTIRPAAPGTVFELIFRYARERWWLFTLAMAALLAEWAWRQRRGLP